MVKLPIFLATISIILVIVFMGGCGDDSTTSPTLPDQSSLLLSRLVVSMVPGASETVLISATNSDGSHCTCTISNSNPGVAGVTISDSTLHITGVDYGTTNLTVTGDNGKSCVLPIQVYDPFVLNSGELLITYVDTYNLRWNDQGSGGTYDGSFFHPVTTDGFRALGSLACGPNGYPNPNGLYAMMVVKAVPGSDALADPVGYEQIYNDANSGANMFGSFWRPIPPEGYVALGTVVANNTWNQPSLSDVVCVRSDLTIAAETGAFIYNDLGTGAYMFLSCWKIDQPTCGPHDYAYLAPGTFVGVSYWDQPTSSPMHHVLNVDLPMLAEAPYQSFVPKLTGYVAPPEETLPMMGKAMLVPCSIVSDQLHPNMSWRVANSPLYRLERQIYYKLLYHNHNQTSEMQTNSVTIRSGVTVTESQSYWEETAVSLSVEAGVSIEFFSSKVTATVSQKFGYQTQTSVSELQEIERTSSVNTAPGKAAALWQQYNRYILMRHNGTAYEPVSSWEFGINSYVTDEYPD